MANSYFQFKKFRVDQQDATMKVCTDSCLFGAFTAKFIQGSSIQPNRILDIGTGSGLLTLMVAQKFAGPIDAIEVDEGSFNQATFNFQQSPWKDQIRIFREDIRFWGSETYYDFILCNPPFFENDLPSTSLRKNTARHSAILSHEKLLVAIQSHLNPSGNFGVLLPHDQFDFFQSLAFGFDFHALQILEVRPTQNHPFTRTMAIFKLGKSIGEKEQMTILELDGNYSKTFRELLADYYLKL
ncbi:MAG: tRNA1(Val) (adenine(37)-N6)-methyltransferase [Chitinophagaceae bacterium]